MQASAPSKLELEHIDARLVTGFLTHLEAVRSNGASSRNVRLAAVKSFMRFMQYRVPSALEQLCQEDALGVMLYER